jgi:tetratricopeptide (TPR) repeat protein
MSHYPRVYVLDTNALLNDPEVVYAFSGSEVVIPAVVLRELDELKRRRNDARIRFHGRKATRLLFEVSKNGRLLDGIPLDNGSMLRVDPSEQFEEAPAELDLARPDDLIIALAYSLNREPGVHATLVTNDLNMLLRGEALGLEAYRFEGKLEHMRERRESPMEWLRRRRLNVMLALLACLFFTSTVYLYATRPSPTVFADLPALDETIALQSMGMSRDEIEQHYRGRLRENRNDADALVNLGNLLYDQGIELERMHNTTQSQARFLEAVDLYNRAVDQRPDDPNLRTDLGIALLKVNHYRDAVETFRQAIADAPSHPLAHYNLGVAYAVNDDVENALAVLEQFLWLAQGQEHFLPVWEAQQLMAHLQQEAQQARQTGEGG